MVTSHGGRKTGYERAFGASGMELRRSIRLSAHETLTSEAIMSVRYLILVLGIAIIAPSHGYAQGTVPWRGARGS